MERLTSFATLPATIKKPGYTPERHGVGIVHLGLGAFHRGHMAVYTDQAMAADGGDWRILGVSLRNPDMRDRLGPQNGLYTLVERSEEGVLHQIIGSIKDVLVAPESPEEVLAHLTAQTTKIVSMTITEKGYLRDPASGALMHDHPDVQHDLKHPEKPKTMHGFVVEALDRIRQNNASPFTPLCCDNLPSNGDSLKRVILEFAQQKSKELATWIKANVVFPNTMVDRIVPATTSQNIDEVSKVLGVVDQAPVFCEPFSQWVIEDCMPEPHPDWEQFGVRFVEKVAPFEEMKLRLLNGSHSALAYLGYLGGFEYIHEVIADPDYLAFTRNMMRQEVIPTLAIPEGENLEDYSEVLIRRFSNPTLCHRTWQIAMDGSLKIPQRLLDTVRDRIADGQPYKRLALAVAGWLRYITGIDEQGQAINVSDPFAERLRTLAETNRSNKAEYVRAILRVQEIFGTDLCQDSKFSKTLCDSLQRLYEKGAKKTLSEIEKL